MSQRLSAKIVAIIVAGSGVLNLASLMGGPTPTGKPLRGLFPLDFAGLSRTATLLLGFALVLTAIHLWGQKRRACQLALVIAGSSAFFHLTKGWDIEEAVCSGLVASTLWFTRRQFRIGAGRPQLITAVARAATALAVAGLCGAVGFWLLEPKEFHHNFHWWDAGLRTIRLMLFVGDQSLVPRTYYAVWFLDSLFWISAAAFLYSGLVLFRPVTYQFRLNRNESALAGQIAGRYGRSGQDFFKHWPDKSYFFSASRRSFLGYRVNNHYALVLGDPVGPAEELESTIEEFVGFCHRQGWRVGFHQVGPSGLPVYEALGFRKLKVGQDAIVHLARFSLNGSAMKEFRNTVNRLDRLGYCVERIDPPLEGPLLAELKEISDGWLEIPGHRERQFTLGRFEPRYVQSTSVYVVFDANRRAVAFLNLVPSYQEGLATVDLMRRRPETVNGVMDYLFAKALLDLKARGVVCFSLGMAPLDDNSAGEPAGSDERLAHWLMRKMPFIFRSDSLRRFKAKYADQWTPRYAVYESRLDLPRLAFALRRVSELPQRVRRTA